MQHCLVKPVFAQLVKQFPALFETQKFFTDDDIPENLVKQCMQLIKGPLAHIYNLSLNSGVFPDIRKTAKVKPLYKKGDKCDMRNYRPISIIPVFGKLLQRFLISDFRRDLNIENVLLGISPASICSWPTFRNAVSVPSSKAVVDCGV